MSGYYTVDAKRSTHSWVLTVNFWLKANKQSCCNFVQKVCVCVCVWCIWEGVGANLNPKDPKEKEEDTANQDNVPNWFSRGNKSFDSQLQFWGLLDHPGTHKHTCMY